MTLVERLIESADKTSELMIEAAQEINSLKLEESWSKGDSSTLINRLIAGLNQGIFEADYELVADARDKIVEQAQRIEELESYIRVAYLEGGCVDYRDNLDKCWNESDAKEFINTQDT